MSQPINAQLLKALCDMIALAESNGPIDFADDEERELYERAVALKKEASEPCPLCTSAEQLCEACGGHGVVPKGPAAPIRIVAAVRGGCLTAVYSSHPDVTVDLIDFDDLAADAKTEEEQAEVYDEATKNMVAVW